MATWYKEGVCGKLSREASNAKRKIAAMYEAAGEELHITSVREGTHRADSFHPQGDAFDFRKSEKVTIAAMKARVGKDYDIVPEGDHNHCEYDPKE
jgi:hypothetical protein